MRKYRFSKLLGIVVFNSLLVVLLGFSFGCTIPTEDGVESIEALLQKVGAVEGEMTFETEDGDIITIAITKEESLKNQTDDDLPDDEKNTKSEKDYSDSMNLGSILPYMESVEDVFQLLQVLEAADGFREEGLTWSHIAAELDYDADTMYTQLEETIEERLKEAKALGLISHEQLETKYMHFTSIAMDWVQEIFPGS